MKIRLFSQNQVLNNLTIILLIVSNICFYTLDTIGLYLILTALAIVIGMIQPIVEISLRHDKMHGCVIWLIAIYSIFTYNGLLRLRFGIYNWDMMLYTCLQNIIMYFAFLRLFDGDCVFLCIKRITLISLLISILVLVFSEIENIETGGIRIGDSLSGNVNVAGANFGILSIFLSYLISRENKGYLKLLFCVVAAIMLLTGSKMTIIVLSLDMLFFFCAARSKANSFLKLFILALILIFLIFTVPYFYNIIGVRIEDMIYSLFGIGHGQESHSTSVRKVMIREGLQFFLYHPLIGGGEKYFGSLTSTIYSYSHCNYIEILCNFGLIGFGVYYLPLVQRYLITLKTRITDNKLRLLTIILVTNRLLLDWMQITHSEPCVGYIPMVFVFAYCKKLEILEKKVDINV